MDVLAIGYKGNVVEFRIKSGLIGRITGVNHVIFEAFENIFKLIQVL